MFKVMTLNINGYGVKHGPWEIRRDLIVDAVRSAGADVVAFQAVVRDPSVCQNVDQAAQVAERLPEFRVRLFQPATRHTDGREDGLAVLSQHPILESDWLELSLEPGLEDNNRRVVLTVRVQTPVGSFQLYNAHFSWVESQALDNVGETLDYLSTLAGAGILVGDLNSAPDSAPMEQFRQAGWHDAWGELRPQDPGLTFEAGRLVTRIDYAWLNGLMRSHLRGIEIVADGQGAEGVHPSDHVGLLITLG
jgi:endonuclease/exonuclease/phosphatase family metal-dependent hydrolase